MSQKVVYYRDMLCMTLNIIWRIFSIYSPILNPLQRGHKFYDFDRAASMLIVMLYFVCCMLRSRMRYSLYKWHIKLPPFRTWTPGPGSWFTFFFFFFYNFGRILYAHQTYALSLSATCLGVKMILRDFVHFLYMIS